MALLLATSAAIAAERTVTMELDQQEVSVGQAAELTVTVNNGSNSDMTPPAVPGLEFSAINQSKSIQWINGSLTSSTSVTYEVMAQRPGVYKIPSLTPGAAPLTLRVVADGSATGGQSPPQSPSSGPAQSGGQAATGDRDAAATPPQGLTFARLLLNKDQLYLGETIPIDIQLGIQAGIHASLDGAPALSGDAFVVSPLSNHPMQEVRTIAGKQYTVVTWHATLSALKTGDYPLNVEVPVTLQIPQSLLGPPPKRAAGGSLFDDPFADSFFQRLRPPVEKQLKVSSKDTGLKVIPLPLDGKPADFGGAVGQFTIDSALSASKANVGDPITLSLRISGVGNFDRVDSPVLNDAAGQAAGWKTYRPTSKFTAEDDSADRGIKAFDEAIVATRAGSLTVPALSFSYFDPEAKRYQTLHTEPSTVAVAGGSSPLSSIGTTAGAGSSSPSPPSSSAAAPAAASVAAPPKPPVDADGLRPDRVETGAINGSLWPLYLRPAFLAAQLAILLGFLAFWLSLPLRRRLAARRDRRRQSPDLLVDAALAEMRAAAAAGDSRRFLQSARLAVQRRLAAVWRINPQAVTLAEIESRVDASSESGPLRTGGDIRQLLVLADEADYSGRPLKDADLQRWAARVTDALQALRTFDTPRSP